MHFRSNSQKLAKTDNESCRPHENVCVPYCLPLSADNCRHTFGRNAKTTYAFGHALHQTGLPLGRSKMFSRTVKTGRRES